MHLCRIATALLITGGAYVVCASSYDSSSYLFDTARIMSYNISFYCSDWSDSLEYYKSLDEAYIPARFSCTLDDGSLIGFDSIGVRYKGNSSYTYSAASPKRPFKFRFDKYVDGQRFFGVEKLNFSNVVADPSYMRERIAYAIVGRYMAAPRTGYATISVNDTAVGFYTQVEQVDELFLTAHFAKPKGNLYKSCDNGSTLSYNGPNQSSYEAEYDLKTNSSANDYSGLIGFLDLLANAPDDSFALYIATRLDVDNILWYLAFNMVFSNFDSYTGSGRNFYLYDDPVDNTIRLIPWDLNMSFGSYANGWNVITNDIVSPANMSTRPLMRRMLANDSLKAMYLEHIATLIDGPASPDSIAAMADAIRPLIESYVAADSNSLYPFASFATNIEKDYSYMEGAKKVIIPGIKSFATARTVAIRSQLAAADPIVVHPSSTALSGIRIQSIGAGGVTFSGMIPSSGHLSVVLYDLAGRTLFSHEKYVTRGMLTDAIASEVAGLRILQVRLDGVSVGTARFVQTP